VDIASIDIWCHEPHEKKMNVVIAKRCNMHNVFYDFNKYNVIPIVGNMDRDGG